MKPISCKRKLFMPIVHISDSKIFFLRKKVQKIERKKCARNGLWSDHIAIKVFYDQSNVGLNPPLIRPSPDRSDIWSYLSALEPNPRPCNFGLETHRLCWTWVWSEVFSVWQLNPRWYLLNVIIHFWWGNVVRWYNRYIGRHFSRSICALSQFYFFPIRWLAQQITSSLPGSRKTM